MRGDVDPDIALDALKLLIAIEHQDDEIARLYLQALRLESIREMSHLALEEMLKPAMIPALLEELHDPDPEFRADVIHVIAEVGGGL